jgi:signal transduction histidine kinase
LGARTSEVPAQTPSEAETWTDDGLDGADATPLGQRQLSHDIHHELGTILMLASLLSSATDVGPDSKVRARQMLDEIRWLDQLQRAYEEMVAEPADPVPPSPPPRIRLDAIAAEVVATMRLATLTRITLIATEAWAHTDRLAYWRALRNIVGNAVRAAGDGGHVEVRVTAADGWAVVQIDDDGPGLGAVPPGRSSLGLGIAENLAAACGGRLEIGRGVPGGCRVRLSLPTVTDGNRGPAV